MTVTFQKGQEVYIAHDGLENMFTILNLILNNVLKSQATNI